MNRIASVASALLALVLALVLCSWAVVAVGALAVARLAAVAAGVVRDEVRDLFPGRR